MKKEKSTFGQLQVTILTCAAVISAIVLGSSIVAHYVDGESNAPSYNPPTQETTPDETTESTEQPADSVETDSDAAAGSGTILRVSGDTPIGSQFDHIRVPYHCYVVVGYEPTLPKITASNTLVVPGSMCGYLLSFAIEGTGAKPLQQN